MSNLTTTAYVTRKLVKYGAIFIVFLLIGKFIFEATTAYIRKVHPPPPPPPTITFSKLPAILFPKKDNIPNLNIRLETIDGTLPKLPTINKVYLIYQPTANLLALDRAKELANKMGFKGEPARINDTLYRFVGQNPVSTLEIDIISQKFKLSYDFSNDESVLSEKKLPNDYQATREAKGFLSQAGLLTPSLSNGSAKVTYLKYNNPGFEQAISLSEADFVRVDLFPQDLDDLKILASNPNQSLTSFIFSGSRDLQKRIIEVNHSPLLISPDNNGTYPLKTPASAWEELLGGGGYIASLDSTNNQNVFVRKVYLAYFESETPQNFLQPIFVFEGDPGFTAYIPAVDPKHSE